MLRSTRIEQLYREEAKGVMDKVVDEAFDLCVPDQTNPNAEFRVKQKFRNGFRQIDLNFPDFYGELNNKIMLEFPDEEEFPALNNVHTRPKPKFFGKPGSNGVEGHFFNSLLHNAFLLVYNDMNSATNGNDVFRKPYTEKIPFKFGKANKKPFEFKFDADYNISDIHDDFMNILKERERLKAEKEAAEKAAEEAAAKKKKEDEKNKRVQKAINDERQRREEQLEQEEIAKEIEKALANEFPEPTEKDKELQQMREDAEMENQDGEHVSIDQKALNKSLDNIANALNGKGPGGIGGPSGTSSALGTSSSNGSSEESEESGPRVPGEFQKLKTGLPDALKNLTGFLAGKYSDDIFDLSEEGKKLLAEVAETTEQITKEIGEVTKGGGTRRRRKKLTNKSRKQGQVVQTQSGGSFTLAAAADDVLQNVVIPVAMKIPELLLRLMIPLARGQIKKLISEKLEDRPLQARVFILTSIEITVHSIIKENMDWYGYFDKNFRESLENYAEQMGELIIKQKIEKIRAEEYGRVQQIKDVFGNSTNINERRNKVIKKLTQINNKVSADAKINKLTDTFDKIFNTEQLYKYRIERLKDELNVDLKQIRDNKKIINPSNKNEEIENPFYVYKQKELNSLNPDKERKDRDTVYAHMSLLTQPKANPDTGGLVRDTRDNILTPLLKLDGELLQAFKNIPNRYIEVEKNKEFPTKKQIRDLLDDLQIYDKTVINKVNAQLDLVEIELDDYTKELVKELKENITNMTMPNDVFPHLNTFINDYIATGETLKPTKEYEQEKKILHKDLTKLADKFISIPRLPNSTNEESQTLSKITKEKFHNEIILYKALAFLSDLTSIENNVKDDDLEITEGIKNEIDPLIKTHTNSLNIPLSEHAFTGDFIKKKLEQKNILKKHVFGVDTSGVDPSGNIRKDLGKVPKNKVDFFYALEGIIDPPNEIVTGGGIDKKLSELRERLEDNLRDIFLMEEMIQKDYKANDTSGIKSIPEMGISNSMQNWGINVGISKEQKRRIFDQKKRETRKEMIKKLKEEIKKAKDELKKEENNFKKIDDSYDVRERDVRIKIKDLVKEIKDADARKLKNVKDNVSSVDKKINARNEIILRNMKLIDVQETKIEDIKQKRKVKRLNLMQEIKKKQEVVDMLYELSAYISTALRDAGSKKKFKKAIEQTGGGVPGKYPPEYYRPCCTPAYLDPNYIKLLLRTLKRLCAAFPDLIGELNLLPKVLEKYFTNGVFDSLLQLCLCEKIKKLLMNDPQFMTFMEVAFKTYPMGVRFKKQFVDRPEKTNSVMFFNNFQQLFELKETSGMADYVANGVRDIYNKPSDLVKSLKESAEKNKQKSLNNAISDIGNEIAKEKEVQKISAATNETEINESITDYISELPKKEHEQANKTVNTINTIVQKRESNTEISNEDIIFIKDIKEPFKQVLDRRMTLLRNQK